MRNNPAMAQMGQIFGMAQALQNPQAAVGQMMGNNEQMQQVMQYISGHGNDPRLAFYTMAKEKGVNPDDILNQAMQLMGQM